MATNQLSQTKSERGDNGCNGKRLNVYKVSSVGQSTKKIKNGRTLSFSRAHTYYMTYYNLDIRRSGESSCAAWQYIGEAITVLP